jgi:hypothetical protein
MTATTKATLIARRIRQGYNAKDSISLLDDIIARHDGCNLAYALVYNGFATITQANRITAA